MRRDFSPVEIERLASLDARFRLRAEGLIAKLNDRCAEYPWHVLVVYGRRSPEEQAVIWAVGRELHADGHWHVTGKTRTNAPPGTSKHELGLAVDLALVDDHGPHYMPDDHWCWTALGEMAEAAGLVWGGRWRMRDLGHVELEHPKG